MAFPVNEILSVICGCFQSMTKRQMMFMHTASRLVDYKVNFFKKFIVLYSFVEFVNLSSAIVPHQCCV